MPFALNLQVRQETKMDWDETDDHDFSDSEVDYYMGKEPRKTGGSKQHIHQHPQKRHCGHVAPHFEDADGVKRCGLCQKILD
jgi:hypothetical protein